MANGTTYTSSTSDTWVVWVGSASATTTTDCTWRVWTGGTGSSITSSTTEPITWVRWNQAAGPANIPRGNQAAAYVPARVSKEERERRAAEEARWKKIAEEERAARLVAEEKAERLLQSLLTPEQRETLENKKCFYLHSAGKKYRIDRGSHGNVKLVDERDEVIESYCIQPVGVPVGDSMAAQKLLLETDPESFRRIANITPIRRAV